MVKNLTKQKKIRKKGPLKDYFCPPKISLIVALIFTPTECGYIGGGGVELQFDI